MPCSSVHAGNRFLWRSSADWQQPSRGHTCISPLVASRRRFTKCRRLLLTADVLLNFPAPKLRAYPRETVVAEKFEAMVKLGMANSRMKDFYDLWVLAKRFEFESATLAAAIQATFKTRRTTLPRSSPLALQADFYELPTKPTQWRAVLRKSGLKADSSLKEIIELIGEFVMPVVNGLSERNAENKVWQPGGPWGKDRRL